VDQEGGALYVEALAPVRTYLAEDEPRIDAFLSARVEQGFRVVVVLPAHCCADTIGPNVRTLLPLRDEVGAIDELWVIDDRSPDGDGMIAAQAGAAVAWTEDLIPEIDHRIGQVKGAGKGRAMAMGDLMVEGICDRTGYPPDKIIVVWLDANLSPDVLRAAHILRLAMPIMATASSVNPLWPPIQMVQGYSVRLLPGGSEGARTKHLAVDPELSRYFPQLRAFIGTTDGELAYRLDLGLRLHVGAGYTCEPLRLLEASRLADVSFKAMAQAMLPVRLKQQPQSLGPRVGQSRGGLAQQAFAITWALQREAGVVPVPSAIYHARVDSGDGQTNLVTVDLEEQRCAALQDFPVGARRRWREYAMLRATERIGTCR
jgi:hypothetical protein